MKRCEIGALGEKITRDFLITKAFPLSAVITAILMGKLNHHPGRRLLLLLEIMTSTSTYLGSPEESANAAKQAKLTQVALHYL